MKVFIISIVILFYSNSLLAMFGVSRETRLDCTRLGSNHNIYYMHPITFGSAINAPTVNVYGRLNRQMNFSTLKDFPEEGVQAVARGNYHRYIHPDDPTVRDFMVCADLQFNDDGYYELIIR